jgi:capsular polysaccharide biosynthesis protein
MNFVVEHETEIDLKKLAIALMRRWYIVVGAACIAGVVALLITRLLITPLYSSTITMYVNNRTDATSVKSSGDLSTQRSLVDTYIEIIRSRTVLDDVLAAAELTQYTTNQLNSFITAGAQNATELFYITVTTPDAAESARLANSIASTAPKYLSQIVDGSSLKIVDMAKVITTPTSPSYPRNIAIGVFAGVVIAGAVVILTAVFDVHISSEADLRALSELPILGVISDFSSAERGGYGGYGGYGRPVEAQDATKGVVLKQ